MSLDKLDRVSLSVKPPNERLPASQDLLKILYNKVVPDWYPFSAPSHPHYNKIVNMVGPTIIWQDTHLPNLQALHNPNVSNPLIYLPPSKYPSTHRTPFETKVERATLRRCPPFLDNQIPLGPMIYIFQLLNAQDTIDLLRASKHLRENIKLRIHIAQIIHHQISDRLTKEDLDQYSKPFHFAFFQLEDTPNHTITTSATHDTINIDTNNVPQLFNLHNLFGLGSKVMRSGIHSLKIDIYGENFPTIGVQTPHDLIRGSYYQKTLQCHTWTLTGNTTTIIHMEDGAYL